MNRLRRPALLLTLLVLQGQTCGTINLLPVSPTWGDGSAGVRVISGEVNFKDTNLQFTNFTVQAGATMMIQSGAVIRATGRFINNGTILVEFGAEGGTRSERTPGSILISEQFAVAGIGTLSAGSGEIGDAQSFRLQGTGGAGISEFESRQVLTPGTNAGGGGAAGLTAAGGDGGGALTILAQEGVVNNGEILADGADAGGSGAGGGGGGAVILASAHEVINTQVGVISVTGGDGGPSGSAVGPGGGGGGGLVHMLGLQIIDNGTVDVAAGAGGDLGNVGSVTATVRSGGGGGGPSVGDGGSGGMVMDGVAADPMPAADGEEGESVQTLTDPAALF